jgi:hypothetical protein
MSEQGRKRLKELAQNLRAREKITDEGRHKKGLVMIELMARDLTGDDGMPELKLLRDAPSKFRLQRGKRNADIALEWQRDIGAAVMTCQKHGEAKKVTRYILDESADVWRRMEGEGGELYADMEEALVEFLYPEAKQPMPK